MEGSLLPVAADDALGGVHFSDDEPSCILHLLNFAVAERLDKGSDVNQDLSQGLVLSLRIESRPKSKTRGDASEARHGAAKAESSVWVHSQREFGARIKSIRFESNKVGGLKNRANQTALERQSLCAILPGKAR